MKKLLLLLVVTSTFLSANNLKFTGTDQAFVTKYIWRGISFNQKPVHQASFDFEYGNFGFNIWLNRDLTDEAGETPDFEGSSTEYDFTISYGGKLTKSISYETGLILYQFPENVGGDTDELYYGVSFDGTPLAPSITLYYDYLDTHLYISLDAGYGFGVSGLDASIDFHLGLGSGDFFEAYLADSEAISNGDASAGLTDFSISFSLAKQVTKALNISTTLTYTGLIADATTVTTEDANADENDNNFVFSLNLGYSL